jgi:hypothetical protein
MVMFQNFGKNKTCEEHILRPFQEDYKECSCGEMRHKDEICGHGYADGICCVCPECSAEMKDNESEDEEDDE